MNNEPEMLSVELQDRIAAYATRKKLTQHAAVLALIDAGLRASERAAAAGTLRGASFTSKHARKAANARWQARK
jgi:hypothetical protein